MLAGKIDETTRIIGTNFLCRVMSGGLLIVFRCESMSRLNSLLSDQNAEMTLRILHDFNITNREWPGPQGVLIINSGL